MIGLVNARETGAGSWVQLVSCGPPARDSTQTNLSSSRGRDRLSKTTFFLLSPARLVGEDREKALRIREARIC